MPVSTPKVSKPVEKLIGNHSPTCLPPTIGKSKPVSAPTPVIEGGKLNSETKSEKRKSK